MKSIAKKHWITLLLLVGIGSFGGWYYFFYDPNYCYKNQTHLSDEQYIDIAVHGLDDAMNQVFVGHSSYEKIKVYLKKYPGNIVFRRDITKPKQFEWVAYSSIMYVFDQEERDKVKKNYGDFKALNVQFGFDACGNYTGTEYEWIENTQAINKKH